MAMNGATWRALPPRWAAGLCWALWALAILGVGLVAWLDQPLREAGRPDLIAFTPTNLPPLLGAVAVATVGAVVASRRRGHAAGWLLLVFGMSLSAAGVAMSSTNLAAARGAAAPAGGLLALYIPATIVVSMACNGLLLLLTPTGSLPSPRWRWLAAVTVATPVVVLLAVTLAPRDDAIAREVESPLDLRAFETLPRLAYQAAFAVAIVGVLLAAASLVVRYRRARGVERRQLQWLTLAVVVVSLLSVVVLATLALGAFSVAPLVGGLCPPILAAAVGAAVLRYRLYDLDRIISRTLAYALVTLLLGGGYAVVVLGLGQLLGQDSPLVVATATLAVAAAFQPARRRVQQVVDRRFNRRRYDAGRTIEAFGARLRQEIDLDTLRAELLTVVDRTMQPTSVALWLRPSGATRRSSI
jgi:hypothetical protein